MDASPRWTAALDARWIATATCLAIVWLLLLYRVWRSQAAQAVAFSLPAPEQCKRGWVGREVERASIQVPGGSTAIQCYAPATGHFLGLVNPATPDGIDRIVAKAAAAQQHWRRTTFAQRRKVLRTLLQFLLENEEDIVRAACRDSGKTRTDAIFGEVLVTVEKIKWTIKHGEKALRPDKRPTNLLMFYKDNEIRYEPLGVVAACVSWNYPFHNLMGPIISSIFAGNAIIIKNSEQTAWSSAYYCSIVREALHACRCDPNLVHAISCWPPTADHLTSHPGISHVTFVGSKPVAHQVARSAAKSLTPLCVELGGKDAAVVLDQPNGRAMSKGELGRVASIIMRGVFQSAGQNCVGIERVIALPAAYDALLEILEPRIKALRLGNDLDWEEDAQEGVDVGAMISPASFDRLEGLIAEARAQGARLLAGGHRYRHGKYPQGHYFTPTLIVDVTSQMRIAQEELFAPVCVMMRADSVEEAVKITNSTEFGLGCSVFGPTSTSKARQNLQQVTDAAKAGMVAVNDFAAYYVVQLPFGGVGGSGYGRFAGAEGLRSVCNAKSICSDKWPAMIQTAIPGPLDYPMRPTSHDTARAMVEVVGYEGALGKFRGIRRLAGF
ncbi:aldehyde dehydrogenase [Lecanosticta acicola]|uniref:aldehyde dehydrogenase (NAD(+)) n=1 Tax=Lecanosticta acicola TaxID=111012 RepID=A0AAI8Z353_9PEZI|nr:aldehyde dehydrogenase [Lecanosticta acicola]